MSDIEVSQITCRLYKTRLTAARYEQTPRTNLTYMTLCLLSLEYVRYRNLSNSVSFR
jgi:hypothetical protein